VRGPWSLGKDRLWLHTALMGQTTTPSGQSKSRNTATDLPAVQEHCAPAHGGDLARRISHRRSELGLNVEEVARRSGVDAWFLAYFEQSADSHLTDAALLRLATALSTTPLALEGGEIDRPPGRGRAGPHPVLEVLSFDDCVRHLGAGGVGRIVFTSEHGPVAFPVNFAFSESCITLRTSDALARSIVGVVAFEVDRIDDAMSEGWSVLVRGHASVIEETAAQRVVAHLDPEPWAGGDRLTIIEIAPFEITGRVIVQRPSPDRN
jgi:hypothetical protein